MAKITALSIRTALRALADDVIAAHSMRFFKCGEGEYGEGDKFLGIRVPILRQQVIGKLRLAGGGAVSQCKLSANAAHDVEIRD